MFAAKARPLTRFLREDVAALLEDEVSRRAFEQLKSALEVAPILQTLNWNKPFVVYCDASGETVGSTLSQLDENGHDHPIHFASRQLTSAEKNYIVTEQEGLVVIFSLKKFRHYLLGYKAKIVTDHKALT
jgi:pyruvate/2-oxoglutarate dehydrogenase complex dihydrolipoamide dehydrogenase (E3) component